MAATKIEASNIAAGAVASTGFTSVQVFTAASTWTRPTDITKVIVEVQGGGGGGSSGNGLGWWPGAGGGGSYVKQFIDVSSIATATLVVGSAGSGGAPGSGTAGGTTSWTDGTNTISCLGGAPGEYNAPHGNGGLGGVATAAGATWLVNGQNGAQGYQYGLGGSSPLGQGGVGWDYDYSVGPPATGYGGGGAGGKGPESTRHGGAGTSGIVIVWEYK